MASMQDFRGQVKGQLFQHSMIRRLLSGPTITASCQTAGHRWRHSFWSPQMTVITFLLQVLDGAKTLRSAVAILLTHLAATGRHSLPSADPTAYCQARRRLPTTVVRALLAKVNAHLQEMLDQTGATFLGHRVWVVDGSNCSMPDTPELQNAFPQPPGQKPGCGFPIVQFVAVFYWATGAVLDVAIDTIVPHELTLFRRLWHHFNTGDVVLADRAYGSYVDLARLLEKGVYGVFRLHQRRKTDFRRGRCLGPDDRLQIWTKPACWLKSMGISPEAFEQLPETLTVRVIRIRRVPKGFRSRTVYVATTLTDPVTYPAGQIAALYRDRWTVELNLRAMKTSLGMEVLRGQSYDVVVKEIVMHLLAYNLIRVIMWQAARRHGRNLHRLSFAGTLHRLREVLPILIFRTSGQRSSPATLIDCLLEWIAEDIVPHRPNRYEPRRRKRRPKQYSLLQKPRHYYRLQGAPHAS